MVGLCSRSMSEALLCEDHTGLVLLGREGREGGGQGGGFPSIRYIHIEKDGHGGYKWVYG